MERNILVINMINLYGSTGFIGSKFYEMYHNSCIRNDKNDDIPKCNNILYFISTVDNYNIFTDPYVDIKTNLIKLIDVLEECKKHKEQKNIIFNFISSWFVYGKTNDLPAKETSLCNPSGFYSITKLTAEQLLASYCNTFNIKYRILRLTNIIGDGDKKISNKKNALQFMLNNLKNNENINLYDNGKIIRDYMDVEDACNAIKCVIENGPINDIINISNSEPEYIGNLIEYAKEKLNSSSKINYITTPRFHQIVQVKDMWLDNTKLLSCGYKQKSSVYESIDKILKK